MHYVHAPAGIKRLVIRLTIDYPKALVLCRHIYNQFKESAPLIPVIDIIQFLDASPHLKQLVEPFIEEGLKTMYVWTVV
jgi:spore coat polysaccharide biosynthesis protein SpsF